MNNTKEKISLFISETECELIKDRRYFHQNPELSFKEFETSSYIKAKLDEMGVSYTDGISGIGILAQIDGEIESENKKVLLIRADMDALPIEEMNNKQYSSNNNGVMHACGHDAHTAILLGIVRVLNAIKSEFCGTVKFAFQPGEELDGGALSFIDCGALENPYVDACLALHVDSDIDCGKIRIKSGSLYASPDDFTIKVIGKGGHGAEPHNCIDPIAISAKIIDNIINIPAREINPFDEAVVTVGTVNAGTATNIIPDYADITGTARSLNHEVRSFLKKRIEEVTKGICDTYGADYKYEFIEQAPPLINNPDLSDALIKSASKSIGKENCIVGGEPTMAGEDFAYFAKERPSVMIKLGCRNEEKKITKPIHNPMFDIDESCLSVGVKIFADFAIDYLS